MTAVLPLLRRRQWAAIGYLSAWKLVRYLPEQLGRTLFTVAATTIATRRGESTPVRQLRRNLARVTGLPAGDPHLEDLVTAALVSYARYWYEVFAFDRLIAAHGDELVVDGIDNVDPTQGAIITITHSGNWDMAGYAYTRERGSFVTITERLKPHELFDAFVAYRESLGFTVLAHSKDSGKPGEKKPFERLVDHVNAGMVAIFPGERDLTGTGVPVTFFGEEASFPAGPAAAAIRCGVPLHIGEVYFSSGRWCARIHPALEVTTVEETTQRIAAGFEQTLRAHPQDWHMLQAVWVADRADSRK